MKYLLVSLLLVACSGGGFSSAEEGMDASLSINSAPDAMQHPPDSPTSQEGVNDPPPRNNPTENTSPEAGAPDPTPDAAPPEEETEDPNHGGAGGSDSSTGGSVAAGGNATDPTSDLTAPALVSQDHTDGPKLEIDTAQCQDRPLNADELHGHIEFISRPANWSNYFAITMCLTSNGEAFCEEGLRGGGPERCDAVKEVLTCEFFFPTVPQFVNDNFPEHGVTITLTNSRNETFYKLVVDPFDKDCPLIFRGTPQSEISVTF